MDRIIMDFMRRGVVACRVGATAAEVARMMLDNDVSTLVVTDERLNACGIISKTDLLGFYGKDLSRMLRCAAVPACASLYQLVRIMKLMVKVSDVHA